MARKTDNITAAAINATDESTTGNAQASQEDATTAARRLAIANFPFEHGTRVAVGEFGVDESTPFMVDRIGPDRIELRRESPEGPTWLLSVLPQRVREWTDADSAAHLESLSMAIAKARAVVDSLSATWTHFGHAYTDATE